MKMNNSQEVGGSHYERFKIEPVHLMVTYSLNWFQGEALKYVSRHWFKGKEQDLDKAYHIMEMAKNLDPLTVKHNIDQSADSRSILNGYVYQYWSQMLIDADFSSGSDTPGQYWFKSILDIIMGEYKMAMENIKIYKEKYYGTESKD